MFGRTDPELIRPQENNHIGLDRDDLFGKDDVMTNNQLNLQTTVLRSPSGTFHLPSAGASDVGAV